MNTCHDTFYLNHGLAVSPHERAGRYVHLDGSLLTGPTDQPVLFVDADDGNTSVIAISGGVYDGMDGVDGGVQFETGADPATLSLPPLPIVQYVIGATGKLEPLDWAGSAANSRRVVAWRGPMNGPYETVSIIAPYTAP